MISSSAEAEFRALAYSICKEIFLRRVLCELRILFLEPMKLLRDNRSIISIAKNLVHHDRTKIVGIDIHFVKEEIRSGTLFLWHIQPCHQTANISPKHYLERLSKN